MKIYDMAKSPQLAFRFFFFNFQKKYFYFSLERILLSEILICLYNEERIRALIFVKKKKNNYSGYLT